MSTMSHFNGPRSVASAGASTWAAALVAVMGDRHAHRASALASVENSDFNIKRSLGGLYALYRA